MKTRFIIIGLIFLLVIGIVLAAQNTKELEKLLVEHAFKQMSKGEQERFNSLSKLSPEELFQAKIQELSSQELKEDISELE